MIAARAFASKTVAVFGLARTGLGAVRSLVAGGANVIAWDDNAVARDLGELGAGEIQFQRERSVFLVQRIRETQRVVRAHRAAHAGLHQPTDRMLAERRHDPEPDVADRADVKRHATLRRQPHHRGILHRAHAVLHALHSEEIDRLAHARGTIEFASMALRDFAGGPGARPDLRRLWRSGHLLVAVEIDPREVAPVVELVDCGP
jgi:threonine dehydrogenase-like Zn-dependent dehydrogenase